LFLFIGRANAERAVGTRQTVTGVNYWIWAAIPLMVLAAGKSSASLPFVGEGPLLDPSPFWLLLGVSVSILAISGLVELVAAIRRRIATGSWASAAEIEDVPGVAELLPARRAAVVLSALMLAVPALGVVRSLSTQVLLALAAPRKSEGSFPIWSPAVEPARLAASSILVVGLVIFSIVLLCLATGPHVRVEAPANSPNTHSSGWRALATGLTAVVMFCLISVALWPVLIAEIFGPIAVAVAALGGWIALVGLFSIAVSFRAPLGAFRAIGLRSDPVLLCFLIVPILVVQFASTPDLHSINRTPKSGAEWERDSLGEAFEAWLERNGACEGAVPGSAEGPVPIRPLVLVAAEGGGIRAAVWTVSALSELVSAGTCTSNSVFLSSGVSGGSVGLAIAANPPWDPEALLAADQVTAEAMAHQMREGAYDVAKSRALAMGIGGLIVTDPIATITGIRLPSLQSSGEWRDRASLIEDSWRVAYGELAKPFDTAAAGPTGLVALNSTDIRSGCRVVVSQVELGQGDVGLTAPMENTSFMDPIARCSEGQEEPALTIDLLDFVERCSGRATDWATAALLSARFPLVTPSGTIGTGRPFLGPEQCGRPRLQLVDGGYAENSGLGLLADTAPAIGEIVRDYNMNRRSTGEPLVVPYLMYVQNSPEPITEPGGIRDTPEVFVPLVGIGTDATQVAPSSWIQRIMASVGGLCSPAEQAAPAGADLADIADCEAALEDLAWSGEPDNRIVIMQAETQPSIAVPLGWELSDPSYCQLVLAADLQAGYGSSRPFELDNALGNYLRLFPTSLNSGSRADERCPVE
jgi:hypothetical protein